MVRKRVAGQRRSSSQILRLASALTLIGIVVVALAGSLLMWGMGRSEVIDAVLIGSALMFLIHVLSFVLYWATDRWATFSAGAVLAGYLIKVIIGAAGLSLVYKMQLADLRVTAITFISAVFVSLVVYIGVIMTQDGPEIGE